MGTMTCCQATNVKIAAYGRAMLEHVGVGVLGKSDISPKAKSLIMPVTPILEHRLGAVGMLSCCETRLY